jgi:hypothetical protein
MRAVEQRPRFAAGHPIQQEALQGVSLARRRVDAGDGDKLARLRRRLRRQAARR